MTAGNYLKMLNKYKLLRMLYLNFFVIFLVLGDAQKLSPVIFVPGDGGSQLDAKLNKTDSVHYLCQKTSDWFNIWLNMELLVPIIIDCWVDNIKLYYNNVTRKTSNTPGVQIRVPKWGDPAVVEWIDPSHAKSGAYFVNIANALVTKGYIRNLSLRGAPYDFRKAPSENKQWFIDMKELVEDTYIENNYTKVTLITHSMGSLMTLVFLQNLNYEWKSKYISRFISLAGPWAGCVKALKVFAMGDDLGAYSLSASTLKAQQISSPSLAWLLPSPYFWAGDEVLIQSKSRTYTRLQLKDFFNDLDYETGWNMYQDSEEYIKNIIPPDVELHCLYGSKLPTVERLQYTNDNIAGEKPKLLTGDGDGTVNARSLTACTLWQDLQKHKIIPLELPKAEHLAMLADTRVIDYIVRLLVS